MEWTKNKPNKEGVYWARLGRGSTSFTHGMAVGPSRDDDIIFCRVSWSDADREFEALPIGSDVFYSVEDSKFINEIEYWSSEPIEEPKCQA